MLIIDKVPKSNLKVLSIIIAGITASMMAAPVYSAETAEVEEKLYEKILVTAQKRSQSIQEIPFSISAKSGEDLEKAGATGFNNYLNAVPGVNFKALGPGMNELTIRGASGGATDRDSTARKPGVGVYFDEAPVALALFNPDLDSFDVQRVEVLRGPQGTLYGSGSLSGTVRIITNKPSTSGIEGAYEFDLNSVSDGGTGGAVKGAINIPVGDNSAIRLVGYINEYAGFIDRVQLVSPTLGEIAAAEKDANSGSKNGGRISFLHEGDTMKTTLTGVFQRTVADGLPLDDFYNQNRPQSGFPQGEITVTGASALPPTGELEQFRTIPDSNEDDFKMFNALFEFEYDSFDIVSSTTFLDRQIETVRDQTLRGLGFGVIFNPGTDFIAQSFDDSTDVSSVTQEVRFVSTTDSDLQWIAGAFYQQMDREYIQIGRAPGWDELRVANGLGTVQADFNALTPDSTFDFFNTIDLTQIALFGELNYAFNEKWDATVGVRVFDFEEDFHNRFIGFFTGGEDRFQSRSSSEDGINPRFILSYKPVEDYLISFQAAKGFRLGSSNPTPSPAVEAALADAGVIAPASFESENVWNYEVNGKMSLLDGRVTVNAAIYRIDYTDIQLNATVSDATGSNSLSFIDNAGEAEINGFELDVTWLATDDLDFTFSVAQTKAELSAPLSPAIIASEGDVPVGSQLPNSPEWTYGMTVNYWKEVNDNMEMFVYADYSYVDDSIQRLNGDIAPQLINGGRTDSYINANFRAGILTSNDWEYSVYINNLTNEVAQLGLDLETKGGSGGTGRQSYFRNTPRTIGMTIRRKF
jgi:outer membrane receptor protein involved in Fe transport